MTENKRFMIKKDGFDKYVVSDKLNQFPMPITNKTSCEAIAFALNSLWEQTKRFEKHNQELIQENIKYGEEIDELKNENEKLKQENKKLQGQLDTQKLINKSLKINEEYNKKAIQKLTVQKLEIRKWINDKISYLEKKYEFGQTEYKGCPMHNIQFGINILKELQEYWEEQEND